MSDFVIKVENLGKKYLLQHQAAGKRYVALRDVLADKAKAIFGKQKAESRNRKSVEEFWALKDVSFEVKQGEAVGIIGRNGAGKSTLLKLLSRITEPTTGRIRLRGRVASLLEVGTGFHPELTGRENIFLNGAVLGMHRAEIRKKFDEIVAFAEVEKFLDTPVKRYSSGMYMRLAFAVAAHLEPEILIVDEVLAVGDAEFQKKCLGKMQDVGAQGRTVLFVSHSMPVILRLCNRVLLLKDGQVLADGLPESVTKAYLNVASNLATAQRVWADVNKAPGDEVASLHSVRILDKNLQPNDSIDINADCFIEIEYFYKGGSLQPTAVFHLINEFGIVLFASADFNNLTWRQTKREKGLVCSRCRIPAQFLAEGQFSVLAAVCTYNPNVVHAMEPNAIFFQCVDRSDGNGVRGEYAGGSWPGVVRPMLDWEVTLVKPSA
jgi:lipopolysaccharide transport system ATP-binding protein